MAALDPASAPAPAVSVFVPAAVSLSASAVAGRSRLRVLATAAAVAVAMTLEVTGPPRPFLFSLRLPLAVLAIGAVWTEVRWRGERASSGKSIPMATPCLVLTSTAGVAAVTVKLVSLSPVTACALLSVASAACCLAVGLLVMSGRRRKTARARRRDSAGVCYASGDFSPASTATDR